ncbi:MAG: tandem-95 repeat protein [Sulfitobacter sp.]
MVPPFEYEFSFANGPDAWKTWMAPSVQREPGGVIEEYTRLNAPGDLDPNHIDGIGPIWLVSHLSLSDYGAPGRLDLNDAQIEITIRTEDFEANGAQLAFWVIRYLPEQDVVANYYVGLQSTNWAYTGGDFIDELGTEWATITVDVENNPDDWTYAGNYESDQGDWGKRYVPYDLDDTLSNLDATLHLVMIGEKPDQAPTGFIDIANIKILTQTEAEPINSTDYAVVVQTDEDVTASGQLEVPDGIDPALAVFSVVGGSASNGSVTIDNVSGSFDFTPDPDFWGPDRASTVATFRYTVSDGTATSAAQSVLVKVAPINDAPLLFAGNEDVEIVGDDAFTGRLRAGIDPDRSERLTFEIDIGSVQNGTVDLNQDTGAYVFTPTVGFAGTAGFGYTVTDGQVATSIKIVNLTVTDPAVPPDLPSFGEIVQDYLIPGDIDTWVYWVAILAENGDVNASYHYGTWLGAGRYFNQSTADAVPFLETANGTVPDAALQLATLYTAGDGVDRDYTVARAYLESLPDNATALYRLGVLDDLGFGGPVDPVAALNNYIEAAKAGDADAMYTVGRRYQEASGTEYQAEDAYFWLGVGLKLGGGPPIPQFDDLLIFNQDQVSPDITAARLIELDDAIASWQPGDTTPVNDAPVLNLTPEAFSGPAGATINGALLNGSDVDGDTLEFLAVENSAVGGTVNIDTTTGDFGFEPTAGFSGLASFSYQLTDGQDESAVKTVTIDVAPGLDAVDDDATVGETGTISTDQSNGLLSNDQFDQAEITEIQDAPAVFDTPLAGEFGTLTVAENGGYTYVADAGELIEGQVEVDTFSYTIQDISGATDQADLTINVTGESGIDTTGSGIILGSDLDDILRGGSDRDVIVGREGDDRLEGGSGAPNELYGQQGNDTYLVETVGDTVVESTDQGIDTIETPLAAYTLNDNVENLTHVGVEEFAGTGNSADNQITGAAQSDVLLGLDGDDTLLGQDGDDDLSGGTGSNVLNGGAGTDTADYSDATGAVVVKLNGDFTQENGSGAQDTLIEIENVTGSDFDDVLIGDNEANVLDGGSGADVIVGLGGDDILIADAVASNTLQGGTGNDRYTVLHRTNTIVEFADEGIDTVESQADIYRLRDNLENLTNDTDALFNGLGNSENNVLTGGTSRDNLFGYDGDDLLIGGDGAANQLIGGTGDDTYRVTAVGDSVIEYDGEGTDTVETNLTTYTLRDNVENLDLLSPDDATGTGNALANELTGGAGDDTLTGLEGADLFVFSGAFGRDVITDFNIEETGERVGIFDFAGISTFADLDNGHIGSDAQGDALITLEANEITLVGVDETALMASHFVFDR